MAGVRLHPEMRKAIEAWAEQQDGKPSLSEAIRRLLDYALRTFDQACAAQQFSPAQQAAETPRRKPLDAFAASAGASGHAALEPAPDLFSRSPAPIPSAPAKNPKRMKPRNQPKSAAVATAAEIKEVWDTYPPVPDAYQPPYAAVAKAYTDARRKGATHEEILAGINRYRAKLDAAAREGEFVPQVKSPVTWFSDESWKPDPSKMEVLAPGDAEMVVPLSLRRANGKPGKSTEHNNRMIEKMLRKVESMR